MRNNVRMFWALYKKDLRQIRDIGLALFAYAFVVNTFYFGQHGLPRTGEMTYSPFMFRLRDLAVAIPYAFPTLLAYMLFMQRRNESRYLEQSLPVWRSMTVITAYLALMTIVIPYAVMTQIISAVTSSARLHAMYPTIEATIAGPDITVSRWALAWRMMNQSFLMSSGFIFIANLSGIVCLATGIASPFTARRWGCYWAVFASTIAAIYGVPAIMVRFGYEIMPPWWIQDWILPGPVLVLAGAWLYGRFADV